METLRGCAAHALSRRYAAGGALGGGDTVEKREASCTISLIALSGFTREGTLKHQEAIAIREWLMQHAGEWSPPPR
jgi:hypothetical protein